MEIFVKELNGGKPLIIDVKRTILDVVGILDLPLTLLKVMI